MLRYICFSLFFFLPLSAVFAADAEYSANQKAYDALGAAQAYALGFTGSGVTVAVVDNGTLPTHQELKDQFSELQKDEYNHYQDIADHGTPVSSLIAGKKDGAGMHGVAYESQIVAFAVELNDGADCPSCYQSYTEAWNILATDEFDNVKIVNNSLGSVEFLPSSFPTVAERNAARALVAKDKLIVASAGNATSLSPIIDPAGLPYYDPSLKYNFISAIAYNPSYTPSSPYFLESYTNLAQYAQEWSLAAPVGSLTAASHEGDSAYTPFAGTSAAAPVISGSAAVVASAFPYMGGKQLADVLFSTADKNYADFSKYMVQKDNGKSQFLFFGLADGYGKDWTDTEKKAVVQAEMGGAYTCSSEGVVCADVTYTDVFGQGLLNLANAVKGPGYFDANRLSSGDFVNNEYVYTVNVQEYDSTWSNNIGQVKSKTENTGADVGLKKRGAGTLTLAGQNTYLGTTVVESGTLRLTGSLAGDVSVTSGTFYLNGGTVSGKTVSTAGGQINVDGGRLSSLTSSGTVNLSGGTAGTVDNRGNFYLTGSGVITDSLTNSAQFYLNGGNIAGSVLNKGQFYLNGGALSGKIQNTGTVQNNTLLKEGLVVGGTLVNQAGGSLYLTSSPETLVNYGKIILSPSASDPSALQQMTVSHLTLAGGGFALDMANLPEFGEGTSYLVLTAENSFDVSDDFVLSNQLGQFIIARTDADRTEKTVSVSLEYLPLSSSSYAPTLTGPERRTAAVIDRLFKNEHKNDFSGYYFLDESGLKKQISKMNAQVTPIHFASLPLSNKLGRTVQTHLFERQISKDPYQYEGRKEYYTPSEAVRPPRGDVYRNYRPGNTPQENYRYYVPRGNDVYRNYRPGNTPQENYRYYVPRKRDVYRNFRPGGRSGGQAFGSRANVWGQILYAKGTYDADKSSGRSDAEGSGIGLMFGWDFVYSKDFLWGLTAGYAQSSIDQDSDNTDVTDLRFGAYFSRQKDFLSVDGILMIGLQSYDKKRVTTLPLKTFEHTASFNGTSIEAALNVGYDLHQIPMRAGDWSFRPYVGASIIQMTQDAYREKGASDLNLSVQEAKDTSVILSPGLIAGFVAAETNFLLFKPEYVFFDLRYEQYLTGGNLSAKAYFSADTLQTMFDSPDNEEKSAFTIGIGINGRLSASTRLNLLVSNRSGSKSSVQSISATLIHSF
ncbi:MAG: S8 family serine peptidase [Alphaproteobacteria bacterium]